ncbi:DMT family transporter [Aliiroseovarius sp. YM-037]|uniref:DMT family transporter n=1 Tax=Aliiroseovarius sp. YM-037 TaxID=3341728 RepID=UPI003A8001F9
MAETGKDARGRGPLWGAFWMIVTGLCFVAVTAIVKHLGGDVPAAQAAFLRYVIGLVFVLPMIGPMLRARLGGRDIALFSLRGAMQTFGVMLWFYAMTKISIAEVTAMNYMSPVYVTIGAALVLGETFAARRMLAVVAALIGALLILRPGVRELSSGHVAMLFTPMFFAVGYLIAKRMADTVSPAVVVGMLSVTVTIGLAPFAWAVWVPVSWVSLGWLTLVAFFATAGHYTMTLAFRAAPVSVTQPATFLQLVWASLLGAAIFAEPLDTWVMLGGGIIIAAISFISWREATLKRRSITPPHTATKV